MAGNGTLRAPTIEYRKIVQDSGDPGYTNRVLIGTATTGNVRIEWVGARYGAVAPVNWSHVAMTQQIPTFYPLRYQVADAQNMIVRETILQDFQWLILLEHDVIIPPDTFVRFDEYMRDRRAPIVSGLYFTRSRPSLPLTYRGRGTGTYTDWEMGDLVYCDGVPTGILLIHAGILKLMWDESEEYTCYGQTTRRVFDTPRAHWRNPETGYLNTSTGTSDLNWCTRIMEGDYLRRAGWHDYLDNLPDARYPFLVDTNIACRHINPNGEQFP